MKSWIKSIVVLMTWIISHVALAAAPIDGWYYGLFGGYTYLPNNVNKIISGLYWNNVNYNAGYDAGGNFGYKSNPMRYEAELTYLNANINSFNINGFQPFYRFGYSNAILALANIYYDFPDCIVQGIQPYLGMGMGYGRVQAKLRSVAPIFNAQFSEANNVFIYQPTVGLTYNFVENWALTLGYRYVISDRAFDFGKAFQAHLANIGVVYRFNKCCYQ